MQIYGYARVSTKDQDCSIQESALKKAGAGMVRTEKKSGTDLENRSELKLLLDFIQKGDVLMITRIDRLARSVVDLHDIVARLKDKGASLKVLEQPLDTATSTGKLMLTMLGMIAEFETDLRSERQKEGIARAKEKGIYKGRPAGIEAQPILEALAGGEGASSIAARLNISRSSIYRIKRNSTGKG